MTQTDPTGGGGTNPPAPAPPAPAPPAPPVAPTPPAPAPTSTDSGKTFTQDEVTRMMTGEKQQGEAAALRRVTETLGVPVEEAAKIIEDHRAAQQAAQDAQTAQQQAETVRLAAAKATRDAEIVIALVGEGLAIERDDQGAPTGRTGRVMQLLASELADDADRATVAAAVTKLKTELPELFAAPPPPGTSQIPAPSGLPQTPPPPPAPPPEGGLARGAARAQQFNEQQAAPFDPSKIGQ